MDYRHVVGEERKKNVEKHCNCVNLLKSIGVIHLLERDMNGFSSG